MKLIFFLFLFLISFSVMASSKQFGVGGMIGNPTGINGKYWLSETRAFDAGMAYSFSKKTSLGIHSDYLLHNEGAFYFNDVYPLDFYYGIGGRILFGDSLDLGVRAPLGLAHRFKEQPVDIFAEIAPILDFISRTGFELHLALGGRFYF
jgi:hypothetical protein